MSYDPKADCKVLYDKVCGQHDEISDFRAKLLALLPIVSGAGIFLLIQKSGIPSELFPHLLAIGLFGIVVAMGLFVFELQGIQHCHVLIYTAEKLEKELSNTFKGAFRCKPRPTCRMGVPVAARMIYSAVIGAWAYIAALGYTSTTGDSVSPTPFNVRVGQAVDVTFEGRSVTPALRDVRFPLWVAVTAAVLVFLAGWLYHHISETALNRAKKTDAALLFADVETYTARAQVAEIS
jgi:hypothetical protein